jgi:hypothetical protein
MRPIRPERKEMKNAMQQKILHEIESGRSLSGARHAPMSCRPLPEKSA